MNKVILSGRITKAIDLRRTQSGKAVASFNLAVDDYHQKDDTDFPTCVAWGKLAERLDKFCGKGHRIAISGRLKTRNYEDAKGQKHYVTEVVLDDLEFLDRKDAAKTQPETHPETHPEAQPEIQPENNQNDFTLIAEDDSNLPF
jgi:single-strand DNA-binding protein